ncbi:MAG: isoprenylcysteine carboxylmethyltransferase family protein [Alphaproteobacteria bacterium]|nr:isoprenylcysteine carboxylmethyltransferase family protein [Alphaproteobacteria bacterium]
MKWLELKIPPLLVMFIFLVDLVFVAWLYPDTSFAFPRHDVAGVLIAVVGLAICLISIRQFKQAETTANPMKPDQSRALITSGIFAYSRNPIYLGMLVFLCGWVVFFANAITLMHPILFVFYLTFFQIKPEERALLSNFGEDYLLYMTRTRRWI